MQFLQVDSSTKLSDIAQLVGERNVESILHLNDVDRVPNVGQAFEAACNSKASQVSSVSPERKAALINTLTQDSDVFEQAALLGEDGWRILSTSNTLPSMLRVPDSIQLPDSVNILGNGEPVKSEIYKKVISNLNTPPYTVDPAIFNDYSSTSPANIVEVSGNANTSGNPMQWFKVPWGEVTLYSALSDERIDFPVYPEEMSDSAKANYSTMPDVLYQYEPWQLYNNSGPRTQTYTFSFHRDMWSGDHTDGKANDLIRACMANCYPEYRGSAVYTSLVTLYVSGSALITGVLTDVAVNWSGPIGHDGFYLECKLELTITEVSVEPLSYDVVRHKPLIG